MATPADYIKTNLQKKDAVHSTIRAQAAASFKAHVGRIGERKRKEKKKKRKKKKGLEELFKFSLFKRLSAAFVSFLKKRKKITLVPSFSFVFFFTFFLFLSTSATSLEGYHGLLCGCGSALSDCRPAVRHHAGQLRGAEGGYGPSRLDSAAAEMMIPRQRKKMMMKKKTKGK